MIKIGAVMPILLQLCCFTLLFGCQAPASTKVTAPLALPLTLNNSAHKINVNQMGYRPDWPKLAYIAEPVSSHVQLVNLASNEVVKVLPLVYVEVNNSALGKLAKVDFSQLQVPGEYVLVSAGIRSAKFKIAEQLYQQPLTDLLRSFYLQRCGQALNDHLTKLSHGRCHSEDGELFRVIKGLLPGFDGFSSSTQINTQGGWHDAGDYGKYVTTTTVSIGRILSAFNRFQTQLSEMNLALPDSGSQPDILTEMQHGLDWLLTMQHPSGAVYRKVSGTKWPKLVAPEFDSQRRYVFGMATDDTAKFAAVMALAARSYQNYQPTLAQRYLAAAQLSWQFLQQQPDFLLDWQSKDDTGSGPYKSNVIDQEHSLNHDLDDRFWAAAELYISTKDPKYFKFVMQHLSLPLNLFEWKDPAFLGKWHLFSEFCWDNPNTASLGFCQRLQQQLLTLANESLAIAQRADYGLANNKFIWGSNKLVAERGISLLIGYQITQQVAFLTAAIEQANYLFGANPFGLSFISGSGEQAVNNVNHIFRRSGQLQIPGLLVGGPNSAAQAQIAPKQMGILSYVDDARSYAVNEYAIDYNAALIGFLVDLTMTDNKDD